MGKATADSNIIVPSYTMRPTAVIHNITKKEAPLDLGTKMVDQD